MTGAPGHIVQMYDGDDRALIDGVGRYLRVGLIRGSVALAVMTAVHRSSLVAAMRGSGYPVDAALANGSLQLLDARAGLESFLVRGYPDPQRFYDGVGAIVRKLAARGRGLRVYGEMVGLLWQVGQYPAAIRLEQLWNRLQRSVAFGLYCGYPIDVFGQDFRSSMVASLFCSHSSVVPCDETGALERALDRAVSEVLPAWRGVRVPPSRAMMTRGGAALPPAEATILWLRDNAPERAEDVIARAHRYYDTMPMPRLSGRTTRSSVP